jgi:hypothetical protein
MDALALLCTLHADGPSTLKTLRQAGCATLESLESMEEERLSRLIGGPPAVARRFVREARHLRERLDPGPLDREESQMDGPLVETVDTVLAIQAPASRPEHPVPVGTADAGAAFPDPMADVLQAWRDRDAGDEEAQLTASGHAPDQASHEELPPRAVRARPEFEFGTEVVAAMRDLVSAVAPITTPAEGAAPRPVVPLADGLSALFEDRDQDLARRLAEEGIVDLAELADDDVLLLSQRFGFGYTRVLRIVQLARRAAAGPVAETEHPFGEGVLDAAREAVPKASLVKLSPSEVPRRPGRSILDLEWNREIRPSPRPSLHPPPKVEAPEPDRESAGGPFA